MSDEDAKVVAWLTDIFGEGIQVDPTAGTVHVPGGFRHVQRCLTSEKNMCTAIFHPGWALNNTALDYIGRWVGLDFFDMGH